jgi:hypothetical protein
MLVMPNKERKRAKTANGLKKQPEEAEAVEL